MSGTYPSDLAEEGGRGGFMLAWLSCFWRWGRNIPINYVALFFSYSCWMGGVAASAAM